MKKYPPFSSLCISTIYLKPFLVFRLKKFKPLFYPLQLQHFFSFVHQVLVVIHSFMRCQPGEECLSKPTTFHCLLLSWKGALTFQTVIVSEAFW